MLPQNTYGRQICIDENFYLDTLKKIDYKNNCLLTKFCKYYGTTRSNTKIF